MVFLYIFIFSLYLTSAAVVGENSQKSDGRFTIKLHRQKTAFEQHLNNGPLLKKYGFNLDWLYKKHKPKPAPRTNDSIPLYRYLDNEFYGTIVMGHPGQTLNVAFDTAWYMSWVLSEECYSFPNMGCLFHNKYDHSKSSGWKPDGRKIVVPEGNYNLSGYFSYDNVSIAHSNVTNFSFIEMTSVPITLLFSKIDGVLGLGLKSESYEPFFYALRRLGRVKEPVFCVYLNRDKQSRHGGNVIMGFIEERHIHGHKDENNNTIRDKINYMPIKPGVFWQFDVDSVIMDQPKEGPLEFCTGATCTAITDTSSNNIIGPREYIDKIHRAIKAKPFFFNRYRIECDNINKLQPITFVIGGQNYTLKGRDYTVKLTTFSVTLCLTAFVPHDYTDFWVLGGAFLSEYYTIYNIDDKQIGFVKAA